MYRIPLQPHEPPSQGQCGVFDSWTTCWWQNALNSYKTFAYGGKHSEQKSGGLHKSANQWGYHHSPSIVTIFKKLFSKSVKGKCANLKVHPLTLMVAEGSKVWCVLPCRWPSFLLMCVVSIFSQKSEGMWGNQMLTAQWGCQSCARGPIGLLSSVYQIPIPLVC